jgi:hypothetical protein
MKNVSFNKNKIKSENDDVSKGKILNRTKIGNKS